MTVRDAARTMVLAGISGMPVIDREGVLVGMVTEGDLLHREEIGTGVARRSWWLDLLSSTRKLADEYVKAHARKVSEVMSTNVITVDEDCPVARIAELLERRRIKRVPVMRDGKMVGLVSRANLLRALVTLGPAASAAPAAARSDDRTIHAAIMQAMKGERWALPAASVIVDKGVVHLLGHRHERRRGQGSARRGGERARRERGRVASRTAVDAAGGLITRSTSAPRPGLITHSRTT
ncbi:CBS domain-containing protein [Caballeronia sp. SL2Y3]|uniref:CBS domain-containing protein n=1 Tax=Caballeronia sp. SL2Y3 TaxID=2878151 RepID=UPI00351CBDC4